MSCSRNSSHLPDVLRFVFTTLGLSCIIFLIPNDCPALSSISEIHVLGKVSASHRRVTLSDLIDCGTIPEDWRKAMAEVDIGEAPSLGDRKYIDPNNLRPFLCQFIDSQGTASSGIAIHFPESIVVERKSRELSQEEIERIFRGFLDESSPWNREEMVIQRITYSGPSSIPTGELSHEVIPSPHEKFLGNVTVAMNLFVDGEKVRTLKVTGKVNIFRNVVQLNRPLQRNETIAEADLEIQRINVGDSPDRFLTQPEEVINKRLVRNVEPHQPIEAKDLDKALVVRRGDMVTIVYDDPGMKLTARGQVREDGCTGDNIRIHNVSTNKNVICRVLDAHTVQATH